MKILLIEDNLEKQYIVSKVIFEILGESNFELIRAKNFIEGTRELENTQFDLLVLDLLIPRNDDETPDPDLGMAIVKQVASNRLKKPKYVVGLTAYEAERDRHADDFGQHGWQLIHFERSDADWESRFQNILIHASDVCAPKPISDYDYDIAILTAISHVEYEAVMALDANWLEENVTNDDGVYHAGTIRGGKSGRDLRVIASSAIRMGMPASTALSMKMINLFRPRFIFMLGIAAGIKGKGNFGDVLIADQAWDYGSGKSIQKWFFGEQFAPAPEAIPLHLYLRSRLAIFRNDERARKEICDAWPGGNFSKINAHLGAIGSGAAVLENPKLVKRIRNGQRKVIGIEMETYGVFIAAETAPHPKPLACSIKSICDFGDRKKNDSHQSFAAFTSANFFYRFVQQFL